MASRSDCGAHEPGVGVLRPAGGGVHQVLEQVTHGRRAPILQVMCRNIRTLHNFEPPATDDEVRASALQYVRKISGFTKPSQANAEAFEQAVDAVAGVSDAAARPARDGRAAQGPRGRGGQGARSRSAAAVRRLQVASCAAGLDEVAHLAHGDRQRGQVEHVADADVVERLQAALRRRVGVDPGVTRRGRPAAWRSTSAVRSRCRL